MFKSFIRSTVLALSLGAMATGSAFARSPLPHHGASHDASVASGMSVALPVALSVATPAVLSAGASVLTVRAIEVGVNGTVWVLENVAEGVSTTVRFAGNASQAVGVGAGTVLRVAVVSSGLLLYHGSQAVAFLPNELGRTLMHNERLTW